MRFLLDTHALLWWRAGDERLSPRARRAITDAGHEVFVSAASAWEIATKVRRRRLASAGSLAVDFEREIRQGGFSPLGISISHASMAGAIPGDHNDPFDRILAAQAREEKMVIISNDRAFDDLGASRIW